ncbi:MAG: DNA topoisomerase IB [Pseudomonadota bacterium]
MKSYIHRIPKGKSFVYLDSENHPIQDRDLKSWIKSLVIPPAWNEVFINPSKTAKLHAWGRDAKGRKQYVYNPNYRKKREQRKFDRIIAFAERLSHMRKVTGQHLCGKKLNRNRVLACMTRLLDGAYFRPGNPAYTAQNETYGLTTLRSKHLNIEGATLTFNYRGKSGQQQEQKVTDRRLANIVRQLDEMPGYEIFQYIDENGKRVKVSSYDLNQYIREIMGEEFSAKDFRTWAGTYIAAITLDELGICDNPKSSNKNICHAVRQVSKILGNTQAVARASYIDPRVFNHYSNGTIISSLKSKIKSVVKKSDMTSPEEKAVLALIQYVMKKKL